MLRFIITLGADTLTDNRDDCKVHGADNDDGDEVYAACHAVCRNLRRAEHGDNAGDEHAAKREETVFNGIRNRNFQNTTQHLKVAAENVFRLEVNLMLRVERKSCHDNACHRAGKESRHCNACNARFQNENADGVADHVDDVHEKRNVHRQVRLFHGTEQRRRGIINAEERERERRDEHIRFRRLQNAFFRGAV